MKKVDIPQVLISTAAIFGIGLIWYDFNVKVFVTVRDLMKATLFDPEAEEDTLRDFTLPLKRQIINFDLNFCMFFYTYKIMSDNKLVKTITDAATLTGLVAGIGWVAKKVVKENFTSDPSSSVMNYVQFTAVMAGEHCAQTVPRGPKNPSLQHVKWGYPTPHLG